MEQAPKCLLPRLLGQDAQPELRNSNKISVYRILSLAW